MKDLRDHPFVGDAHPGTTSRGFIEGLRSGCGARGDQLARLYGPFIHRIVRKAVRDPEDALEVTQTTLLAVLTRRRRFVADGEPASFRRWVAAIARTNARQHFREAGRRPKAIGGDGVQAAIGLIEDREENDPELRKAAIDVNHRALDMVRSHFREKTFKAAWLVGVERLPVEVVAERLGMSRAAIHTARSRVLNRLREVLGGNGEDESAGNGRP